MLKIAPDNEALKLASEKIDTVNQYVNKCKGDMENTTKLVVIERSIYGCEVSVKICIDLQIDCD